MKAGGHMPQAADLRNPVCLTAGGPGPKTPLMSGEEDDRERRKERLARALRANLARRKEQARRRKPDADAPEKPDSENGCPN
jgi:hypothetical protein